MRKSLRSRPLYHSTAWRVGEVDGAASGIVELRFEGRHGSRRDVSVLAGQGIEAGSFRHQRQLPEADPKPETLHFTEKPLGVRKPLRAELPLAPPVGPEPPGVEMDHVAREAALAHSRRHVERFLRREVRHARHPRAVAPQRGLARNARQAPVIPHDRLHRASADEEQVQGGRFHGALDGPGGNVGKRQPRPVRGVDEQAVAGAGHVEWNVLVRPPRGHPQGIGVFQHDRGAGKTEPGESLAGPQEALARAGVQGEQGKTRRCRRAGRSRARSIRGERGKRCRGPSTELPPRRQGRRPHRRRDPDPGAAGSTGATGDGAEASAAPPCRTRP